VLFTSRMHSPIGASSSHSSSNLHEHVTHQRHRSILFVDVLKRPCHMFPCAVEEETRHHHHIAAALMSQKRTYMITRRHLDLYALHARSKQSLVHTSRKGTHMLQAIVLLRIVAQKTSASSHHHEKKLGSGSLSGRFPLRTATFSAASIAASACKRHESSLW
jgi:hypothetical protein